MKNAFNIKSSATAAMIFLVLGFISNQTFAQSNLFLITGKPVSLTEGQTKVFNYALTTPHVGNLMFVKFTSPSSIGQTDAISISIPSVNNGVPMTFEVKNATFDDPQHYSVGFSGSSGYVNLYFSPEGTGATIDLVNRLFVLIPFGSGKGILTERNISGESITACGNRAEQVAPRETNFCEGDCGTDILDVLLLRTPEANNWLLASWGMFNEWFLYVESHNINLAFANSVIPNKRVRVTAVNYTPDFAWSIAQNVDTRINQDLISVSNSATAQNLMNNRRADIVVLLTNNNYTGTISIQNGGGTGTIFGISNSLDPFSTNKFCIVQVANIDPSRYTLAHEIGHQFGCQHSSQANGVTCPFGLNMTNGRNTIMANNAPDNSRIPNFSNPNVFFGGVATGTAGTRNNAQQIRAAFCESANNNPDPQFSVSFNKTSIGPICLDEVITLSSTVFSGICIEPPGTIFPLTCGVGPYQYEWRLSTSPNFTSSQVIGTSANVTFTVTRCPYFYIRLTVVSSNGLTTTMTKSYNCGPGVVCEHKAAVAPSDQSEQISANFQVIPNPTSDEITVVGADVEQVNEIECFNLQGIKVSTTFLKNKELGQIRVTGLNLSPGLYLLRVSRMDGSSEVVKVIIQ